MIGPPTEERKKYNNSRSPLKILKVKDLKNIFCIQILPFVGTDPDAEVETSISTDSTKVIYRDEFGKNKLFKNISFNPSESIQDVEMMEALVSYTTLYFCKDEMGQPIASKNTCMACIEVLLADNNTVKYRCGLYVSGFDNYERGTVEDFLLSEGAKAQNKKLRDLHCKTSLQTMATVDGGLGILATFSGIKIPADQSPVDVVMKNLYRSLYFHPLFSINKMDFFTSSWFFQAKMEARETPDKAKDFKWLEEKIKERLFFKGKSGDHKKILKDAKTSTEHLKALEKKAEDEISKDKICFALFGRTGFGDVTSVHSCFRTEKTKDAESGGMPYYFNDSEQVFLSFLQLAGSKPSDSPPTIRLVTERYQGDLDRMASSVSLRFYSFFDMCRFCRGTFSQVLSNAFLHDHLAALLKKEKINMPPSTKIDIHAFGYDRNVNKGEK